MATAILDELNMHTPAPFTQRDGAPLLTPARTTRWSENPLGDIDDDVDDDEAYFLDDEDDEGDDYDDDYDDDEFEEEDIDTDVEEDYDDDDL